MPNIQPATEAMTPMEVAQVFVDSGMFPDARSVAVAASKLIVGRGLGLTDYDSMNGLHIIKGKCVLASNTMAAAIKASGKYDYRAKTTTDSCTITFYERHGSETTEIGTTSFTMDDAANAGLRGDNWRKWPKAMLFARAISAGYREHCPDALGSAPVYVMEHGESEIPDDPKQPVTAQRETPKITDSGPLPEDPKHKLIDLVQKWCGTSVGQQTFIKAKQILSIRGVATDGSASSEDIVAVCEWVQSGIDQQKTLEELLSGSPAIAEHFEVTDVTPIDEADPWGE